MNKIIIKLPFMVGCILFKRKYSSVLKQHVTFCWLFSPGYSWNRAELYFSVKYFKHSALCTG